MPESNRKSKWFLEYSGIYAGTVMEDMAYTVRRTGRFCIDVHVPSVFDADVYPLTHVPFAWNSIQPIYKDTVVWIKFRDGDFALPELYKVGGTKSPLFGEMSEGDSGSTPDQEGDKDWGNPFMTKVLDPSEKMGYTDGGDMEFKLTDIPVTDEEAASTKVVKRVSREMWAVHTNSYNSWFRGKKQYFRVSDDILQIMTGKLQVYASGGILLDVGTSFTIKVGSSSIEITSSGVNIKGSTINLN